MTKKEKRITFSSISDMSVNSICKNVSKFSGFAVFAIFSFFIAILWWTSSCLTSYIPGQGNEKVYFVKDYPFIKIPLFILILTGLYFLNRSGFWKKTAARLDEQQTFIKVKYVLLGLIFVLTFIWAVSNQSMPAYDQDYVLSTASRLFSSDFHDFYKDQYIGAHTNQIGLVFWEYLLMRIVGIRNVIFFEILNAFFVALTYKNLSEIGELFGMSRVSQLIVLASGLLFWPLMLYSSFLYGTLPGLALSLSAILGMLRFLDGGKWYMALLSGLLWIPAIGVKENYLIFLIGTLIYCVVECIRRKDFKKLWYPLAFAIICVLSINITRGIVEKKIGFKIGSGVSPWAYITMGLQENDGKAHGWYNAYIRDSFSDAGYDTEVQKEAAKNALEDIKQRFSDDHTFRNSFFLKKTVSQWDEPTFQGFWINQTRSNGLILAKWAYKLRNDSKLDFIRTLLDVFMLVIYTGALLFALFCPEKKAFRYSVFAIIFIGGFLFHLVWEAKAQYTLPYFTILIPYAVMGISESLEKIEIFVGKNTVKKKKKQFWNKPGFYVPAIAALVGLGLLMYFKLTDSWIDTSEDTQTVKDYLAEEKEKLNPAIEDGVYVIHEVSTGAVLYMGEKEDEEGYNKTGISTDKNNSPESRMTVRTFNGKYRIFLKEDKEDQDRYHVLEVYSREGEEYRMTHFARMKADNAQELSINKEENGHYTILQDHEHILTYDPVKGSLYLAPYDENLLQNFEFESVKQ